MANYTRINELLTLLGSDRYHPDCPKAPSPPRKPLEVILSYETLWDGGRYTYTEEVSALVDRALEKAGIPLEALPATIRDALDKASVEITNDGCGDHWLKEEWTIQTPNPRLEAETRCYEQGMEKYTQEVVAFEAELERRVKNKQAMQTLLEDTKDRAEFERLKKKYSW